MRIYHLPCNIKCYILIQHRVPASWFLRMFNKMKDNRKQDSEKPIPATFENVIHRSKMATSIRAKVPNQLNKPTNPRGGSLSSEPRSSQTELFKPKQVTSISGTQLGQAHFGIRGFSRFRLPMLQGEPFPGAQLFGGNWVRRHAVRSTCQITLVYK